MKGVSRKKRKGGGGRHGGREGSDVVETCWCWFRGRGGRREIRVFLFWGTEHTTRKSQMDSYGKMEKEGTTTTARATKKKNPTKATEKKRRTIKGKPKR